ncbi:MAG: alanine racemase [Proteobacteria bacterium]|nr:alanine racemase [Pseudomonadota bacterium]
MSGLIRAVIDTQALRHNLNVIRTRAGRAKVIAVVKANAYGHGLVSSALAIQDATAFAVARLEEGMSLRAAGITAPILLLEGVFSRSQLEDAAQDKLDLVIHNERQIELLEQTEGAGRFTLWIKIDTGMNRLGFAPRDFAPAYKRIRMLRSAPKKLRLMTHLACADERDGDSTRAQLKRFEEAIHGLNVETSILNSAGLLSGVAPGGDWVRPGLALYGASPFSDSTAADFGLRPVMTLISTIITVREVLQGERVGYGGAWTAPRDSRIAIVAAGYGDGVHRSFAPGTPVLVRKQRAPLVGRVSMDMIAVDVTGIPGVEVGTAATLWGEGLPVEEVARHAGTIPYELLCSVSQRVPLEPH